MENFIFLRWKKHFFIFNNLFIRLKLIERIFILTFGEYLT